MVPRAFPDEAGHGCVVLNFRQRPGAEYDVYAAAYRDAGRELCRSLRDAAGYPDTVGCPIVLLYRHSLELYIKGVLILGDSLLQIADRSVPMDRSAWTAHRLATLVPSLDAILRALGWRWPDAVEAMASADVFREYLEDLESKDPLTFSFRYPLDKKGNAALPHHFRFNALRFAAVLDPVLDTFDAMLVELEREWERCAGSLADH